MCEDIIELLKNQKLREIVVSTIKEVYSYAGTLYDNPEEDMKREEDFSDDDFWYEAWWRAEINRDINKVDSAFEKYVFERMKKPYVINPKEIRHQFESLFMPGGIGSPQMETIDFDSLYAVFVEQLRLKILAERCSRFFPICIISEENDPYKKGIIEGIRAATAGEGETLKYLRSLIDAPLSDEVLLWEKNGLKLFLCGKGPSIKYPGSKEVLQYCVIRGNMSEGVCQDMESVFAKLLPSIILSLRFIEDGWVRNIQAMPCLKEELIDKNKYIINMVISSYFQLPSKKDSMARRVRNSVHLMVESDNQTNDAIGLALSVAALDALLGEKGSDISEKLATGISVLLEPDLAFRHSAGEFIKKVYNDRSRILHGELVESQHEIRSQARHLASATLFAILARIDFMKKSGYDTETPQDLFQNIRESRFHSGQFMGVVEYNVRKYWNGSE